jgi:hypothetical protein
MIEKNKKLYLDEDQDLLKRLNSTDPRTSVLLNDEKRYELDKIQIESILRSRKTAVDLDESNKKFSLFFIFLAIVQILIALFQFCFDIVSSPTTLKIIGGLSMLILLAVAVYFAMNEFRKNLISKKPSELSDL